MNSPNPMQLRRVAGSSLSLAALLLWAATAACGGSSGGSSESTTATGGATLTIIWPEATRLIPVASNSIKVTFLQGLTTVSTQTVTRPTTGNTSTVTFPTLPSTTLTLKAEAFPNTSGGGVAQASASKGVTILANDTINVAITMASTISTISVTPASPAVAVGSTTELVGTALNASGATVLVSTATASWTSSDTSVATVTQAGVVTGVSEGTATITYADSESGVSGFVTVTVGSSASSEVVDLANAYLDSLTSAQRTATLVSATATNAAKWSNLPATPSGTTGTNSLRNGVAYSTLTTAQKTAWTNLARAALGTAGYNRLTQIRQSDNYLGTLQSGYNGDYAYIGILGTPSASGGWLLQIGGHHIANNYYFQGNEPQSTTPYFLGVEPQTFTVSGTTYTSLQAQRNGMYNLINSLTTAQLASAKLSSNFSDVYLGPGKDARSNFPTGTSGRGVLASTLTTAQQTLLKTAIAAWTDDSAEAATYQSLYESELAQTYVAYSGTTNFTSQGDYVRIDGPHVWIEFVCQNGVVISGQIHFHTVWRDRVSDYNAAYGF
ncbi:DUF3500 domain-containing protein [bacterium]|nr:MAG: DUF3500 domain-containing protein [bacterium]